MGGGGALEEDRARMRRRERHRPRDDDDDGDDEIEDDDDDEIDYDVTARRERLRRSVRHIRTLYVRTMDDIPNYGPREISQLSLAMAKIATIVDAGIPGGGGDGRTDHHHHHHYRRRRHRRPNRGYDDDESQQRHVLRAILANAWSGRDGIFQSIVDASRCKLATFDVRCLTNMAHAYAILGHDPTFANDDDMTSNTTTTLFDVISECVARRLADFVPRDLAGILRSFDGVGRRDAELYDGIARHIVATMDSGGGGGGFGFGGNGAFEPRDVANVLLAYAKAGHGRRRPDDDDDNPSSSLFDALADRIVSLPDLTSYNSQDLANVAWAFAKVGHARADLFDAVETRVVSSLLDGRANGDAYLSHHLSMLVWAYANAGGAHRRLFRAVADRIASMDIRNYKPRELSGILLAYAKAGESYPRLFDTVADHIISSGVLVQFEPLEVANLLLAFAKAGESNTNLFGAVTNRIISLESLRGFNPQALSNLLWACAKSGERNPILFAMVADHVIALEDMEEFTSQGLSNLLWAFAKCDESNPILFDRVADHIAALDSLDDYNPQDLSNLIWAYAKEEGSSSYRSVFDKVATHIVALDNLGEFAPQTVSNIVWAYASRKMCQPLLFETLAVEAASRCGEFNKQEIANILWSYASLGIADSTLFSSLENAMADHFGDCNCQELANFAWACSVANIDSPHLIRYEASFIDACVNKQDDFTVEELSQLHQWSLWQAELTSNIALPSSLEQKCHDAFLLTTSHPSALQNDVIFELSAIGLVPEEEVLTDIGYRLDALVNVRGTNVGIEVDGPFHFLGGRNPTGSTMLKRRQVTALLGMPLVCIPYWEWNERGNNSLRKRQYLRSLLGLENEH